MTKNAKLVLDIICQSTNHLTADDIMIISRQKGLKISMATIYNNLSMLEGKNLIRKISISGDSNVYDRITRHDHLICKNCGKIIDIYLDDLTSYFEQKIGVKINSYDLKLNYLCDNCKEH